MRTTIYRAAWVVLMAVWCALPATAHAETTLRWSVVAEDWVTTTSAEVDVRISATAPGVEGASSKGYAVVAALDKALGVEFRVLGQSADARTKDETNMATWIMECRTRVPVADLERAARAIAKLNIPGTGVKWVRTSITPSMTELEAGRDKLRRKVLDIAKAQAEGLGGTLAKVDFIPEFSMPIPRRPMMQTMRADGMAESMASQAPRGGAVRIEERAAVEAQMP